MSKSFKRIKSGHNKQTGFSLLEVMIALVVANIALLGLVAGELKSLQYANNSFQYTVSLIQGNNVTERILNDICKLKDTTIPLAFDDAYIQSLAPIPGYELNFVDIASGDAFTEEFTVNVSWVDKRMTDVNQNLNQVELLAAFPTVPDGCSVL